MPDFGLPGVNYSNFLGLENIPNENEDLTYARNTKGLDLPKMRSRAFT